MKEDQKNQWKELWKDDFLKVLCGFANAEGGTLVIGRTDNGEAKGVPHASKLLEDLPNKIRDVLGIMPAVRLRKVRAKELIEVRVEPYPGPISFRGEWQRTQLERSSFLLPTFQNRLLAHPKTP